MKKLICFILTVLLLSTAIIAQAVDDYPSCYREAEKDSIVDEWYFYSRESTSFVAWCLNSRNGIPFHNYLGGVHWGNAQNWGSAARTLGYTVDNIPAAGSVAWWDRETYGHVAWVSAVNGDNVTIEEYSNQDIPGTYHERTISASSPTGFIHLEKSPTVSTATATSTASTATATSTASTATATSTASTATATSTASTATTTSTASTATATSTQKFAQRILYTPGQFVDVPADEWYSDGIARSYALGLMKGNSVTAFNPLRYVTIAETVTMAARMHSIYTTGRDPFVQTNPWYQVYLDYAHQNGIISTVCYNSDPDSYITRAQFADIFASALPETVFTSVLTISDNAIPDVKLWDSYGSAVYKLYRAGILTGRDSTGAFSPASCITRAECATIIARMADAGNQA